MSSSLLTVTLPKMSAEWFATDGAAPDGDQASVLAGLRRDAAYRVPSSVTPDLTASTVTPDGMFLVVEITVPRGADARWRVVFGDGLVYGSWEWGPEMDGIAEDMASTRKIARILPKRWRPRSVLWQPAGAPEEIVADVWTWLAEQAARPLAREEWDRDGRTVRSRVAFEDNGESKISSGDGLASLLTLWRAPTRTVHLRP
jgi:hypothetical protein